MFPKVAQSSHTESLTFPSYPLPLNDPPLRALLTLDCPSVPLMGGVWLLIPISLRHISKNILKRWLEGFFGGKGNCLTLPQSQETDRNPQILLEKCYISSILLLTF